MESTSDSSDKKMLPPYLPWKTFSNFIDGFKIGLPSHIDRSVMYSMSGTTRSHLISALKIMSLVDDQDAPTEKLKKLVNPPENEGREVVLQELFFDTYRFMERQGIDYDTATLEKVNKAFQAQGATGDTINKCRSFFLAFAKAAGLELSRYLTIVSRSSSTSRKRTNKKRKGPSYLKDVAPPPVVTQEQSPHDVLYGILDPSMSEQEQQAVWTLLMYLKKQESLEEIEEE